MSTEQVKTKRVWHQMRKTASWIDFPRQALERNQICFHGNVRRFCGRLLNIIIFCVFIPKKQTNIHPKKKLAVIAHSADWSGYMTYMIYLYYQYMRFC